MAYWRDKARELFPEMEAEIAEATDPMALWIDINFEFVEAYKEPRNDDLIKRVYEFESWCMDQDSAEDAANDLPTCVVTTFWEHIPTCPAAREDMARWFSVQEILDNRGIFSYFLDDDNFDALVDEIGKSRLMMGRKPSYLRADA